MAIKPLGKRLLCRLIPKPNQTSTGIVTVETADDAPKMLEVTATGPEVTRVTVGDTILAGRFTGVDVNGAQLLTEEEVLAVLDGDDAARWRVTVFACGGEGPPLATLYDLPTALRHVGPDGAHLITPGTVSAEEKAAIRLHEFVAVCAHSPGSRRRMVISKVPTAGLFKVDGQLTARGVKDETGHYGSVVEHLAEIPAECGILKNDDVRARVATYLDLCIKMHRDFKKGSGVDGYDFSIDAFQSVRSTLIGSVLPPDEEPAPVE